MLFLQEKHIVFGIGERSPFNLKLLKLLQKITTFCQLSIFQSIFFYFGC